MFVHERTGDGLVGLVGELVGEEGGVVRREFVQLFAEIFALLGGDLGGLWDEGHWFSFEFVEERGAQGNVRQARRLSYSRGSQARQQAHSGSGYCPRQSRIS